MNENQQILIEVFHWPKSFLKQLTGDSTFSDTSASNNVSPKLTLKYSKLLPVTVYGYPN